MRNAGTAIMGVGTSTGEGRAVNAARAAITSPLLEASIDGARGILMNIVGGPNVTLSEVTDAANIIHSVAHPDANIIFGSVIDESIGEAVRVTVIAAGFDHSAPPKAATTVQEPAMTEGPRSDIFTSPTNDDFFDVGGDDDLPSFLR
jgi:cell division protein FtsZ